MLGFIVYFLIFTLLFLLTCYYLWCSYSYYVCCCWWWWWGCLLCCCCCCCCCCWWVVWVVFVVCVCVLFGLWVVWVVFVVCFGGWLVLFSKREGRVSDTQNWVVIMFQLIRSWKRPKMGLTHPRIIPMVIYHDISWYIYTSVYLPIIYILYMYMFAIINVIMFLKYNLSILYMPYIII